MRIPLISIAVAATFVAGGVNAAEIAPADVAIVDGELAQSLTGEAGDPIRGREWFADRKLGNCLSCHQNDDMADLPFHGEIGPEMNGVADRYEEAMLRAIVANAKAVFGDRTIMPGFYRTFDDPNQRVVADLQGETILSAQQVEDVVAYLKTLSED